jgi:transposase
MEDSDAFRTLMSRPRDVADHPDCLGGGSGGGTSRTNPQVLARYARQTERWRQMLLELAHACGAVKGAHLARWLGYIASPDTLIRRQRQESFVFPTPRILGVEEFALRRGCISGTLLVDLDRRQPMAVLEGRMAEPLILWLQVHPAIAVLVSDRADAYALVGRVAAPDALQVADRFHLVRNVSDALKTLLHAHRWCQPPIMVQPADSPPLATVPTPSPDAIHSQAPQPTPRKRAVWEAVHQAQGLGQSGRQIARAAGRDRRTVRKYLAAAQPPVYPTRRPRPTQLTPYVGCLAERWAQGCHNARRLYHELVQQGYHGSESVSNKAVLERDGESSEGSSPRR